MMFEVLVGSFIVISLFVLGWYHWSVYQEGQARKRGEDA